MDLKHSLRDSMISWIALPLLAAPFLPLAAQAGVNAAAAEWRAWAFTRLGVAETWQTDLHARQNARLGSLGGGVAACYGRWLGMIRATGNDDWSFRDSRTPGMRDVALMAGARSGRNALFVAGAAGIARSSGTSGSTAQLAPAFDLSAHADHRLGGFALTISGVTGPRARYVAISLGAELGWFGPGASAQSVPSDTTDVVVAALAKARTFARPGRAAFDSTDTLRYFTGRAGAVSRRVGMPHELISAARTCTGRSPAYCHLTGLDAFLYVTGVTIRGDTADVDITAMEEMHGGLQPIHYMDLSITVVRSHQEWIVTSARLDATT